MTWTRVLSPVLVTGATGRVGRLVIDQLVGAGVPVRALTHRPEAAARLPENVEVVTGDLTEPESLDAGLRGIGAVFLVWTVPPATAPVNDRDVAAVAARTLYQDGSWPRPVVDMLLTAWGATLGRPAFVTSTVSDILGSAPRSFRQ